MPSRSPYLPARFPRESWLGVLVLAALALTPLLIDPKAFDDAYMTPKWAWLAGWSGFGVAVALARAFAGKRFIFPLRRLAVAICLWISWQWVAALWAPSSGLAVDRAMRLTWLFAAMLLALQWLRTRRALIVLGWVWIALAGITAFWVLEQDAVRAWFPALVTVRPNLPDWRGFLAGGLGNTSHLGDLLALGMLPALLMLGEARRRGASLLLFLFALLLPAGLIVCYSVGSNLGLILGASAMLVLVLRRFGWHWFVRHRHRWLGLALGWGLIVLFFNLDIPGNPHRPGILKEGFGSERWHEGGPTRLVIWAQSWEMIRRHPILGAGTGNFTYVYPAMRSPLVLARPDLRVYQGKYTNAAHNELLQAWAEEGMVGLLLFLAVVFHAYRSLLRDLARADTLDFLIRAALVALLTAWLAQAQMNFSLQHPAGCLQFFSILFAILLESRVRSKDPAMPSLVNEWGPFEFSVEWATMREPTGIGIALPLPPRASGLAATVLLVMGLGWMVHCTRPVIAQREYRRAMESILSGDPSAANNHFEQALSLDPSAVDVRSRYSDVLINNWGAPTEGLAQLAIVRQRLNSNELYEREARACDQLGDHAKAEQLRATMTDRE